jgi:hypothetical protein
MPILRSAGALRLTEPDQADGIILFNRADQSYESPVVQFNQKAVRARTEIFPVAITQAERPPDLIRDKQSFDVAESLRQRALDEGQVGTIATVLGRQVLASLKPSLSAEPMHLFLSHRRLDGEAITADFHRALIVTAQWAFRDLFDARVGEDAQEIIDERLRGE